jgi:hypothetical protein
MQGFESLARTVIDISQVRHVSLIISGNRERRRAFVSANASVDHVMNSSIPPEKMNAANTTAKHVKPKKREDISAICSH